MVESGLTESSPNKSGLIESCLIDSSPGTLWPSENLGLQNLAEGFYLKLERTIQISLDTATRLQLVTIVHCVSAQKSERL